MNDQPKRGWMVRSVAYFVLAIVAAFVTTSPDVLTMFLVFVVSVLVFEAGYFIYRRWRGSGGRPGNGP